MCVCMYAGWCVHVCVHVCVCAGVCVCVCVCVCLLYMCVHTRILGLPAQTQYFLCRKERFWQVPLNYACTCMHMNTLGENVIRQDAHTHTHKRRRRTENRRGGGGGGE